VDREWREPIPWADLFQWSIEIKDGKELSPQATSTGLRVNLWWLVTEVCFIAVPHSAHKFSEKKKKRLWLEKARGHKRVACRVWGTRFSIWSHSQLQGTLTTYSMQKIGHTHTHTHTHTHIYIHMNEWRCITVGRLPGHRQALSTISRTAWTKHGTTHLWSQAVEKEGSEGQGHPLRHS
jgi:hypothetical protein